MTEPIQIFRAGRQTTSAGEAIEFSGADLRASAEAYDPALSEAPLVVGHPRLDAPAYGWVASLSYSGDTLDASPAQVEPRFAELVRAGRFRHVSASEREADGLQAKAPASYEVLRFQSTATPESG